MSNNINYNFSEIEEMKELIQIIEEDSFYCKLRFSIKLYNYSHKKNLIYLKPDSFKFGNVEANMLDNVDISIYDDLITIYHMKEGKTIRILLKRSISNYSNEQKIRLSLYEWKCYYTD